MSARITLHCQTTRGFSACATSLITDSPTVEEARQVGAAHGWRYINGRDYCAGCSGRSVKPRVIVAVNGAGTATDDARVRADLRLQTAERTLLALVNQATSGDWLYRPATPNGDPGSGGEERVMARHACVASTGTTATPQSLANAVYIATVDPEVGRAVTAVLHEAFEVVHQEHGLVADSLAQAAVDLADVILRTKGER
ncbi:hypothetical protein [Streptomyces eurythermus]